MNTKYKYTTIHKSILGDLHTPVSTYLKVRDLFPQSVLMESSDYHGTENSSFIGLNPIASISVNHGKAIATYRVLNLQKKLLLKVKKAWKMSLIPSSDISG